MQTFKVFFSLLTLSPVLAQLAEDDIIKLPAQFFCRPSPPANKILEQTVRFSLNANGQMPAIQIPINCTESIQHFITGAPVVFLCHGFGTRPDKIFGQPWQSAFAKLGVDVNVITVDWASLAGPTSCVSGLADYGQAVENIQTVGNQIAQLVDSLVSNEITTLENVHFIGHSLGAHVANYLAIFTTKGKIGRITALDPALPCFKEAPTESRLDTSDALFVDVIHTAMGWKAFSASIGHADFFVNGGKDQPGCVIDVMDECNHGRAVAYFLESIETIGSFVSRFCGNWDDYVNGKCNGEENVLMGWNSSTSARGQFFLRTNQAPPYGKGDTIKCEDSGKSSGMIATMPFGAIMLTIAARGNSILL